MTTQIKTFPELLAKVKKIYKDAKQLSQQYGDTSRPRCVYGHDANGIGCAIGCLLPPDVAERLDHGAGNIESVRELRPEDISPYISPEIPTKLLGKLQSEHDRSNTVEAFNAHLDRMIAEYEPVAA